jgi:hypothetical protein
MPSKRQQGAGHQGQRVRRSVEERRRAVSRGRRQVEDLRAPGGATSERGVVLELDGEMAGAVVIAERGRVDLCVWVGQGVCL